MIGARNTVGDGDRWDDIVTFDMETGEGARMSEGVARRGVDDRDGSSASRCEDDRTSLCGVEGRGMGAADNCGVDAAVDPGEADGR